jgi:hypothetical protein
VPDLDAMANAVFAAMHDGEAVLGERYLPPREAEEWRAVRLALEKMPMEVVVELCKRKGTVAITLMLAREA